MIRILTSDAVGALLTRRAARMDEAEAAVRPILDAVRKRGDKAVAEYARKFDGLQGSALEVPRAVLEAAKLTPELRRAVKTASANIRAYAKLQMPAAKTVRPSPGVKLSQIVRPLDCVAAYIPSGRYPLPSTLMMTVIPAQVAGVRTICAASPKPSDVILGTAAALKVDHLYQVGGAHAVAAFAYGTKTIPRADRIVGPGSIWVAAAKKIIAGETGIDFLAGPTETLMIAAEGRPHWIAADMLAQAEHDTDASAVLLTTSRELAEAVAWQVERQLETLSTAAVARKAIAKNSAIVLVKSLAEAVELSNRFAPEHLSIPDASLLPGIRHAGSVFVGEYSPEAAGDYASGPNHVLPTGGVARLRGGLSAADYVKVISVQELSQAALRKLAPAITPLARAEGLEAHARSVDVRMSAALQ
ncbi:MAG: histidinol dehydrogenase, partial [Acidobacteria bacterium]|nr:histidinol dehydrogenase [Acidobacteriota bacterium]